MIEDEDGATFPLTHIKIWQCLKGHLYTHEQKYACVCVCVCVSVCVCVLACKEETLSTTPLASYNMLA